MKKPFFWDSWSPVERSSILSVLTITLFSFIFLFFTNWEPLNNIIPWSILSQLIPATAFVDQLHFIDWHYSIATPTSMVYEWFVAAPISLNSVYLNITLLIGLIGITITLAALTTLDRFWYLASFTLFIILTALSRTEVLGITPAYDKLLLLSIIITYGGVGYYLQSFRPDVPTTTRISIFSGITILLYIICWVFTGHLSPTVAFISYTFPIWITVSTLFFIMSATEILYALVWLSTSKSTSNSQGSFIKFIVISALYLIILLFTYVHNTKIGNWGIVIISPLLLGVISSIIGIFTFKQRCDATPALNYRQTGIWLYSGLLLVTISFASFAGITANDPLIEVFEDLIVATQLGLGIVFLFYILINFYPIFTKGMEVHKVVYKPMVFSLTKARLIGFGVFVVLLSMQKLFPVQQGFAAYFNALGDTHFLSKEYTLAEQYYKLSLGQEFQNHKANYSLASLALEQGDENAATFYFKQATLKKPSVQAYVGLSQVLMNENLYFEALYNLKEGLSTFPNDPHLLNNIGLYFAKTSVTDSAYYYLDLADKNIHRSSIPSSNLLAILGTSVQDRNMLDSLSKSLSPHNDLTWQANWLAIQNNLGKSTPIIARPDATPADSLLNAAGYAYWLNYSLNQAKSDTTLASKLLALSNKNAIDGDELLLASIYAEFYSGDKAKALEAMTALTSSSSKNAATYQKILGHWYLQLGLYAEAQKAFQNVDDAEAIIGLSLSHAINDAPAIGGIVLEKLITSNYDTTLVRQLQNRIAHLKLLPTTSDSLLAEAQLHQNEANYLKALKANPFKESIVLPVVKHEIDTNKNYKQAFQYVVNALTFNEESSKLWESYALLALELGLLAEADQADNKVKSLSDATDYHAFSTRYQARKSLIEKERAEFQ